LGLCFIWKLNCRLIDNFLFFVYFIFFPRFFSNSDCRIVIVLHNSFVIPSSFPSSIPHDWPYFSGPAVYEYLANKLARALPWTQQISKGSNTCSNLQRVVLGPFYITANDFWRGFVRAKQNMLSRPRANWQSGLLDWRQSCSFVELVLTSFWRFLWQWYGFLILHTINQLLNYVLFNLFYEVKLIIRQNS
jgi:hypothetical protein